MNPKMFFFLFFLLEFIAQFENHIKFVNPDNNKQQQNSQP